MTTCEILVRVVTHAHGFGQEKGVGQRNARQPLAADHFKPFLPPVCHCFISKDALELGIEEELADQPAAIGGVGGHILVFAGEELLVINIVSVFGLLQFTFQGGGPVNAQLSRDNPQNGFPLFLVGLTLVFRRHVLEINLLLHAIQQLQALGCFQTRQVVQLDISFLHVLVVTGVAVGFQNLGGVLGKRLRCVLGGDRCEQNQIRGDGADAIHRVIRESLGA